MKGWLGKGAQQVRAVLKSRMRRYPDRREWDFGGHQVTRLIVDYAFGIEIWWKEGELDSHARFTIESPFTLKIGSTEYLCDPANQPSVAPALPLMARPVQSVAAFKNGLLVISFLDAEIRVAKRSDGYETWNSQGSGELHDINMLCSSSENTPWGDKA